VKLVTVTEVLFGQKDKLEGKEEIVQEEEEDLVEQDDKTILACGPVHQNRKEFSKDLIITTAKTNGSWRLFVESTYEISSNSLE